MSDRRAWRPSTGGARYRTARARLLATTDVCGICGHPGARTADHIVPPKFWPRDAAGKFLPGLDEIGNLRPAHGTLGPDQPANRCPTCHRLCNQSRGDRLRAVRPSSRKWY